MTLMGTTADTWFSDKHEAFREDPEYVAEELALDLVMAITRRMRELGLNQSDLARKIGTSPAFVSQLLHGKPNMTLLTLAKLSVALGLDCKIALQTAEEELPEHADVQRKPPSGLRRPQKERPLRRAKA